MKKKLKSKKIIVLSFILFLILGSLLAIDLFLIEITLTWHRPVLIVLTTFTFLMIFMFNQSFVVNTKNNNLRFNPFVKIKYQTIDWSLVEINKIIYDNDSKNRYLIIHLEFEIVKIKVNLFTNKQINNLLEYIKLKYPNIEI